MFQSSDNQTIKNLQFGDVSLHIGQKIQEIAKQHRISTTMLAEMVSTSRQNMRMIFQRKSMDTDLLVRISKVLKHNFFQYYNEEVALEWYEMDFVSRDHVGKAVEESESKLSQMEKRLDKLEKEMATKEIAYLKEINELRKRLEEKG